ncbi:MAG: hypothetical protein RL029_34 [Actinomycetota bacterium]
MRAVVVMFDSLNRQMLPPYGCDWTSAPNFARLAQRSVTFDNCYGGSMPCMPARREMHTARYNFMHRSWGQLEPFDDSIPEILKKNGVYTHLVTDHYHYWEDGGATYHNRFSTFELFRGQEGDPWKGHVADPETPVDLKETQHHLWRQDWINRQYMQTEDVHPQTLTFDAGIEFMTTNLKEDNWFLQIEGFDPHEPFFSYQNYQRIYDENYQGDHYDWPDYKKIDEDPDRVQHVRNEYAALLSFCDFSLGRILDYFDENNMWKDTMLIVCTDHGFLLGEHGWYGKNIQPWYDETIHLPLFIWDSKSGVKSERRSSLVQTIDIGPTLLDYFGVSRSSDMQGQSLVGVIKENKELRQGALFGIFGGHICVTDGRWVYMRSCVNKDNKPINEYTLSPWNVTHAFPIETQRQGELVNDFTFTKNVPVIKYPADPWINPYIWGTILFDLETDPGQENPVIDDATELRMLNLLRNLMIESDAPIEQYERVGIPKEGDLNQSHLLAKEQLPLYKNSILPPPKPEEFERSDFSIHLPLRELMADPRAKKILVAKMPIFNGDRFLKMFASLSPLQMAARFLELAPTPLLHELNEELIQIKKG